MPDLAYINHGWGIRGRGTAKPGATLLRHRQDHRMRALHRPPTLKDSSIFG